MSDMIRDAILSLRDDDLWKDKVAQEETAKGALRFAADNWRRIENVSEGGEWEDDPEEDDEDDE